MWPTGAMRRLGIDVPVVLAPMGGGPSTVALAAAVSDAGGLGSLAGGYLAADRLREEIRQLRAATPAPFAVNLFVPTPAEVTPEELDAALDLLERFRVEVGLPARPTEPGPPWAQDFEEQLAVVLDERVPVFSFAFGTLAEADVERLHAAGSVVVGTATNVAEAVALADGGVDLVCAQGGEAGGHHGSWLAPAEHSVIGTMALVPAVCDAVDVPVIAAGGIMDGRGVAAALSLGAGAAQMGTAFLLSPEAGTPAPHRRAVTTATETDTGLTTAVTGRMARGVRNRLMAELEGRAVPPYPVMNALSAEVRRAAAGRDDAQLMSLWCGQGVRAARDRPAGATVESVVAETLAVIADLSRSAPASGR